MNSIFKDPNFLQKLAKIVKEGQVAPKPDISVPNPTTAGPTTTPIDAAKFMVLELGKQINGLPELQSDAPGGLASPTTNDLQDMDSFIAYLERNQIQINGKRLAYKADQFPLDAVQGQEYGEMGLKLTDPTTGGSVGGKFTEGNYRVYLAGLYEYIKYLQRKAINESNKVLEVMVGKLINYVNDKFQANLPKKPTHVPGQTPSVMDSETILDVFPRDFSFNPNYKTYRTDKEGVPLTSGDLESPDDLLSWLNGTKFKVSTVVNNVWTDLDLDSEKPRANLCNVGKVLVWRARYLLQSNNVEMKKKAEYYLKKLAEVIPQWTDPTGKPCVLDEAATTAVSGLPSGTTPGGATPVSDQVLYQLLQSLPFHQNNIFLDRMNYFNTLYLSITSGQHKAELQPMINSVNSKMKDVMAYSANGQIKTFPLPVGSEAAGEYAQSYVKAPAGTNFMRLIAELKILITEEKKIVNDLLERYGGGGTMGGVPQQNKYTPEQISYITGDLEIANDNLQRLSAIASSWTSMPKVGQ